MHAPLLHTLLPSVAIQAAGDVFARVLAFEIRPVQIAVILLAGGLAREPQATRVGAQVLVALKCEPGRPVGVATARPRSLAPTGIHEIERFGHGVAAEHHTQDGEEFGFGTLCGLGFDAMGLIRDDGGYENSAAGEEFRDVERLVDGIVAPIRGGVQEVLETRFPEDLVGGELQEDFGVDTHLERGDGDLLPAGQRRMEGHEVGLENADGEGADGIIGLNAAAVLVRNLDP